MFVNDTPLTTRPSRTSRQGMTRSGMAFGVATRARAAAGSMRPSSSALPLPPAPVLPTRRRGQNSRGGRRAWGAGGRGPACGRRGEVDASFEQRLADHARADVAEAGQGDDVADG